MLPSHFLKIHFNIILFRNIVIIYGEELLAPRPTPKLEDHPLSAVRDCLFNVYAATLHNGRPFLRPQPEDAPCRGDGDPLNTGLFHERRNKNVRGKFAISKLVITFDVEKPVNFAYGMIGRTLYMSVRVHIVMSSRSRRWFGRPRWSKQVSETERI
jgi:hypothetical protein